MVALRETWHRLNAMPFPHGESLSGDELSDWAMDLLLVDAHYSSLVSSFMAGDFIDPPTGDDLTALSWRLQTIDPPSDADRLRWVQCANYLSVLREVHLALTCGEDLVPA